jgi:hypothetical protein
LHRDADAVVIICAQDELSLQGLVCNFSVPAMDMVADRGEVDAEVASKVAPSCRFLLQEAFRFVRPGLYAHVSQTIV